MSKIIEVTLYEFKELSEAAQSKALESLRYCNVDFPQWDDFIIQGWTEKLEGKGYEDVKIEYSGFYSQGDGASFTARINVRKWIETHKAKTRFNNLYKAAETGDICADVIRIDNRYSHYNTVRAEVEYTDELSKNGQELESWITEEVRALSKELYRELGRNFDALTSNESVIDTINANEWFFTENGKIA